MDGRINLIIFNNSSSIDSSSFLISDFKVRQNFKIMRFNHIKKLSFEIVYIITDGHLKRYQSLGSCKAHEPVGQ